MTKKIRAALKEDRSEVINIRVTPTEKEIFERMAKKEGIPVSQYIRGVIMADLLISGDYDAMKYSLSLLGNNIKEVVREKVFSEDVNGLEKA